MEFALEILPQGNNTTGQGEVYHPRKKWNSGFKAGLGTVPCHDGWDVYGEYTWFHSKNSRSAEVPAPGGLLDNYWIVNLDDLGNINPFGFNSSSAKWTLNMNIVDLEIGRNFYISPRLMLRPFYGLKGTWQRQKMDVQFAGLDGDFTSQNKIKNWGIGVRGGLDSSWHFTKSFSLIGDMALSGLYEYFKTTRFDTDTSAGVFANQINLVEKSYLLKPVIEWSLGLKWETGISCDQVSFLCFSFLGTAILVWTK